MALDANIVGTNLDLGSNIKVALSKNPLYIGGVRNFSENDAGSQYGGVPSLLSPETSDDYRLRVGIDTLWDTENFNYSVLNSTKHKYSVTTLVGSWSSAGFTTNSGNISSASTGLFLQTWRHFPLIASASLYIETKLAFSGSIGTNTQIDFGWFIPGSSPAATILDGIFCRASSSGIWGVSNNNGLERLTDNNVFTGFTIVPNRYSKFTVSVSQNKAQFWIDDVLYGVIITQDSIVGNSVLTLGISCPWAIRHNITGSANVAVQAKVASYNVTVGDIDSNRTWESVTSGMGNSGIQTNTSQTANFTLNTAPIAYAISATAATANGGAVTGGLAIASLGGRFSLSSTTGNENEAPLFAYLVPAASATVIGRNLVVTGIWIDTYNAVAVVGATPTVIEWSVGVGSSALGIALAADVTNGASPAKSPRKMALGIQNFLAAAAIGTMATPIYRTFASPLVVEPGNYLHIIVRIPVGIVVATELFRGTVGINSYWE